MSDKFKKLDKKYHELYILILLEDALKIIYILLLIIGFIYNFINVKKIQKKKFNFIEFIFSIRKC